MLRACLSILLVIACAVSTLDAQSRRRTTRPTRTTRSQPPAVVKTVREPPLMQCPSILGNGVTSQRLYCDVLSGSDPSTGLRVAIPPHDGTVSLHFTLHNRQTYSESEIKEGRAYARYTATLKLVKPTGEVLGHAVVQSEFRTARDLAERIAGGAGPGGVKAVAPTGSEPVTIVLPEDVTELVMLGDRLVVQRLGSSEAITAATAPGRPLAIVSQVEIEYRPGKGAARAR